MRSFLIVFLVACLFFSCGDSNVNEIDVSNIVANVKIDRFDVDFYNSNKNTLHDTKLKYPMLFPKENDSVWFRKIEDKEERALFTETQKKYKNVSSLEGRLEKLFKHIIYYNPKYKIPRVITMLTDIDYDNRSYCSRGFIINFFGCLFRKRPYFLSRLS